MTLDEGIIHAEDVARNNHEAAIYLVDEHPTQAEKCEECAREHEQLAEWLKELKAYKEQSGDAISRQAVAQVLLKYAHSTEGKAFAEFLVSQINELPSVTPQQRTGRWIEVIDEIDSLGNKTWHHECSICGSDKSGWGTYKHCPDCGTKMEVSGCTKNI